MAESFGGQISHLFSKIAGMRHEDNMDQGIFFLGSKLPEIASLNMCQSISLYRPPKIMLQKSEPIMYWFILYHLWLWYFSYVNLIYILPLSFSPLPSEKGRGKKGWKKKEGGGRKGENEKEQRKDKRKIGR